MNDEQLEATIMNSLITCKLAELECDEAVRNIDVDEFGDVTIEVFPIKPFADKMEEPFYVLRNLKDEIVIEGEEDE